MNAKEKKHLERLEWIARLTPKNCPGGLPTSDRAWRDLVNRMVREVRGVLSDLSDASDSSDRSEVSDQSDQSGAGLLHKHGGYRKLRSFQVASLVYDGTRIFCDRFISRRSRTHDQMVQAARSGRQNIAEGSMAAATSRKTELKLTNVAKASLEELLLDYEDYLRQNHLRQWNKDDPEAREVRGRFRSYPESWFEEVGSKTAEQSDESEPPDSPRDPYEIAEVTGEVAANTLLCLINQAIYLLKRQIGSLEKAFLEEGGFTERLYRKRSEYRRQTKGF